MSSRACWITGNATVHHALSSTRGSNIGAAVAASHAGVPAVAFHIGLTPPEFVLGGLAAMADVSIGTVIDPRPPRWRADKATLAEMLPLRSVAWSDPSAAVPVWLGQSHAGTIAYVTLGTVAFGAVEALRRSIIETAHVCTRVLVAAGPEADLSAFGDLPPNVSVERYVDQARALEHADVAVHHGGTGTTLGCLAAGVPQLLTPQGADQFYNAERLVQLGLGYTVSNDAPAGAVEPAVRSLLRDQDLRVALRTVQDEIAAMPSPAQVVQTLAATDHTSGSPGLSWTAARPTSVRSVGLVDPALTGKNECMQTFLPYPSFERSARSLDLRRLGKQRVEAIQVVRAATWPGYRWANHPVAQMWKGYEEALGCYGFACCAVWTEQGFSDTCQLTIATDLRSFGIPLVRTQAELAEAGALPPWLGDDAVHRSHQSALVRKDPDYYRALFPDVPDDLPYHWPVRSAAVVEAEQRRAANVIRRREREVERARLEADRQRRKRSRAATKA